MGNGFLSHHAPPGASPGAAGYHPRASPLYNTVDNMVLYVVYEYNGIQMAFRANWTRPGVGIRKCTEKTKTNYTVG